MAEREEMWERLNKEAGFGRAVLELAKEQGLVPKRAKTVVKYRTQTKVVVRRPRRTKAEMAAATEQPTTE